MKATVELGSDLQEEYESWLEYKKSLGIERTINNFLNYIHHYGTFKHPRTPDSD